MLTQIGRQDDGDLNGTPGAFRARIFGECRFCPGLPTHFTGLNIQIAMGIMREDFRRAVRLFCWIELPLLGLAFVTMIQGPVANRARDPMRKAQARNDLIQLYVAVEAYHTDYGVYPIDPSLKDLAMYGFPGGAHHNFELINTLRADGTDPGPNHNNALNSRGTVYLDIPWVKDSAAPRGGMGWGRETDGRNIKVPGEWYDPWGNPYMCIIDTTGKGISNLGSIYSDLAAPNSINPPAHVVGISFGPDGKPGLGGNGVYGNSDDVIQHNGYRYDKPQHTQ